MYGGGKYDQNTLSPYDIILTVRQYKMASGISESVIAKRQQQGFPRAFGNEDLGMAAVRVSTDLAGTDLRDGEQVINEFDRRVKEGDYEGWSSVAYYREVWDMDTPDEEIISGMTDVLCQQFENIAYEDFSVGVACGYLNDDHSLFGVFAVIGFGCTDGSAHALARINEARESAGVPSLEANYSLRSLTQSYIGMVAVPDNQQQSEDILGSGYNLPGHRIRWFHSGAYSPIPQDSESAGFEAMGNLAASGLLRHHSEVLLRSDWQDIGIAAKLGRNSESGGLQVQAEFVIAWQVPGDVERPAHFPPPLDGSISP